MVELSRKVRILLFEDLEQDAKKMVQALRKRFGASLYVVWFKAEPRFRHGRNSALRQNLWTQAFPLTLKRDEGVQVFQNGKWTKRLGGQYWQSDFDAAILDVYESGRIPAGENFAKWLEHARFAGPVILASFHDLPSSQFPLLPAMEMVNKQNNDWEADAATRLQESLAPEGVRIVNASGQNPDDSNCLHMFWQHVKELRPHSQLKPCRVLWYGDDGVFADKILQALNHVLIDRRPIRLLDDGLLKHLKASRTPRDPWPDFIWIDVGSKTININTWLGRLGFTTSTEMGEELRSPRPLIILISERLEGFSLKLETQLTAQGILCLRRSEIAKPGRWAVDTVESFLSSFAIAKRSLAGVNRSTDDARRTGAAEKLFRAYMRLLVIAQRHYYVSGSYKNDPPSLLRWLAPYPISGTLANTGLEKIRQHWDLLSKHGIVEPGVISRFRRESKE